MLVITRAATNWRLLLSAALLLGCGEPRTSEVVPQPPLPTPGPAPTPAPTPAPSQIACTDMPALDAASLPKLLEIHQPFAGIADAKLMVSLSSDNAQGCAVDCGGRTYCWDMPSEREIGDVDRAARAPVRKLEGADLLTVQTTGGHRCGLRRDRRIVCTGNNANGQLGTGNREPVSGLFEPIGLGPASRVVLDSNNSCAMTDDGVFCWGENYVNALGFGPVEAVATPTRVLPELALVDISISHTHGCVVSSAGAVLCWGEERFGNLGCRKGEPGCGGTAAITPAHAPVRGLPPARAISVGYVHGCALTSTGEIWCWGDNDSGQCSGPESDAPWQPRRVEGLPTMRQVDAGGYHSCGLSETGAVWCWGQNPFGETGPMGKDEYRTPIELRGLPTIAELALGDTYTCVRSEQGQVICWGVVPDSEGG